MATVTIRRIPDNMGILRSYGVVADGKSVGNVAYGETAAFELPEGQHSVWVKMDWCRSNKMTFTLGANGTVCFECGAVASRKGIFVALLYTFFLSHRLLWLKQVSCQPAGRG